MDFYNGKVGWWVGGGIKQLPGALITIEHTLDVVNKGITHILLLILKYFIVDSESLNQTMTFTFYSKVF